MKNIDKIFIQEMRAELIDAGCGDIEADELIACAIEDCADVESTFAILSATNTPASGVASEAESGASQKAPNAARIWRALLLLLMWGITSDT